MLLIPILVKISNMKNLFAPLIFTYTIRLIIIYCFYRLFCVFNIHIIIIIYNSKINYCVIYKLHSSYLFIFHHRDSCRTICTTPVYTEIFISEFISLSLCIFKIKIIFNSSLQFFKENEG